MFSRNLLYTILKYTGGCFEATVLKSEQFIDILFHHKWKYIYENIVIHKYSSIIPTQLKRNFY